MKGKKFILWIQAICFQQQKLAIWKAYCLTLVWKKNSSPFMHNFVNTCQRNSLFIESNKILNSRNGIIYLSINCILELILPFEKMAFCFKAQIHPAKASWDVVYKKSISLYYGNFFSTKMRIGKRSILYLSMYYARAQILIINHPDHSHGHRNKHFPPSHVCSHQAG